MIVSKYLKNTKKLISKVLVLIFLSSLMVTTSCNKDRPKLEREKPLSAKDKRRRNIEEGRGAGIGDIFGKLGGTNFEFSTSNPMWRASLETLDFLPLQTVDYSGGVIISDWYSENTNKNESLKITIRFLSNEIRSDSIKIIVHKKTCNVQSNCNISLLANTVIKEELRSTILREASLLQKEQKKKK